MKLSQLAGTLIGSEIVKLGNTINERIRNGEKIYNFTIGDFDPSIFPIPLKLEELIIDAYKKKQTSYPAAEGVIDLRQSVCSFLKEREGIDYAPNEVQIAAGGRPLIYTIFKTLVDKGDKVIYPVPSWNNNHYIHMNEAVHCMIETTLENNFMPTAADIAPHIEGATLITLCTPQNPTGTTFNKIELEKICDLVLEENKKRRPDEKKLYVLFDQMYWTLTYGQINHYNPVSLRSEMKDYTIFVDGISKAFCATGVRVGWSCGPAEIIAKMKAILSHIGAWAPMAEQKATAIFLKDNDAIDGFLQAFKEAIDLRLTRIYNGFIQLKEQGFPVDAVHPQAAIYLTVKVDLAGKSTADGTVLNNQSEVTAYLLSEAKIAIVPFYAFGAANNSPWYRLSVGTCKSEEINDMLGNLKSALQKLS